MYLNEALLQREDLKKRQVELTRRIKSSLVIQEGETPVDDAKSLLKQLRRETKVLAQLVSAINYTSDINCIETSEGPITITQALARRERLITWTDQAKSLADDEGTRDRYSKKEVVTKRVSNPAELYAKAYEATRESRHLSARIDQAGMSVVLDRSASHMTTDSA